MNRRTRHVMFWAGWILGQAAVLGTAGGQEVLLQPDDLAALDRQNSMWRLVHPEDNVESNLRRWREAGFSDGEIAALAPQLDSLWALQADRHYGWLDGETVEEIKMVDREFIARMRATRLHAATGLKVGSLSVATVDSVNRRWRRAILSVLNDDELAEFRLMNSGAARQIARTLEGVTRSTAEDRRLFQLERDFQLAHGSDPEALRIRRLEWREGRLDHLAAVREVLGDDRFAVYLGNLEPDFGGMQRALAELGDRQVTRVVELWLLKERLHITRTRKRLGGLEWEGALADARQRVGELLGESRLALYLRREEARWLRPY